VESFSCFTGVRSEIFESLVGLDSISTESEGCLSGGEERYDLRVFGPLEDILFGILECGFSVAESTRDMSEHIERGLSFSCLSEDFFVDLTRDHVFFLDDEYICEFLEDLDIIGMELSQILVYILRFLVLSISFIYLSEEEIEIAVIFVERESLDDQCLGLCSHTTSYQCADTRYESGEFLDMGGIDFLSLYGISFGDIDSRNSYIRILEYSICCSYIN
jgi:hypothetical protein